MRIRRIAATATLALLLAGCANRSDPTFPTTISTQTSAPSWVLPGWTQVGDLAWKWTDADQGDCKSYQDGCFGITVMSKDGCPGGIYIEVAVLEGGVVVDRANEITAGLDPRQQARAVLSPPGGTQAGAKAKLTDLSCL